MIGGRITITMSWFRQSMQIFFPSCNKWRFGFSVFVWPKKLSLWNRIGFFNKSNQLSFFCSVLWMPNSKVQGRRRPEIGCFHWINQPSPLIFPSFFWLWWLQRARICLILAMLVSMSSDTNKNSSATSRKFPFYFVFLVLFLLSDLLLFVCCESEYLQSLCLMGLVFKLQGRF